MAEKEYIEREAALAAIKEEIDNYRPNPDPYSITPHEFVRRGLNIAYSIIKNQPTAHVQEVRHGKWIYDGSDIGWANYKCSSCGECFVLESGTPQENEYNFCPNCGTKMDKE